MQQPMKMMMGLVVKEFPNGRIFHIDVDLKTGKTTYLKQLK